jgi:predicted Zn-dependent protease
LLAQVELEQSHADEAVRLLQHFLQLHPDSSTAYYDLSRAYRMLGNRNAMAQAITDYKRTSADAKARGLMAQVTGESAMSSVADNPQVTQADSQPSPQP